MHCVDLGESFQTHIYLENFASIQPRTSPVKSARSSGADGEARQVLRDEAGGLGRLAEPRAQGSGSVDGEILRLACSFFVTLPRIPGKPGRNAIQ